MCALKKIILHILLLICFVPVFSQNTEIVLNTQWQFHQKGTDNWFPASIPGNVHTDLISNEQIPDPFYSDNEKKVQWIENEDWEYKTEFVCDKKTISQNHVELKFEGLDTYAKVYLNEILILEADNMFRSWSIDVKNKIKEGKNNLLIVFESAVKKGKAEATKLPYTLPGDEKIFTRKAQYQYGWDWGPRLVTCGIWKPVKLIAWSKLKIESIYAYTRQISDSVAKVDFIVETNCDNEDYFDFKYRITDNKKRSDNLISQLFIVKKGVSTNTISATIRNPELWWCNGLGGQKPSLYYVGFKLSKADTIVEQNGTNFGIRSIELIQDKDSAGSAFYFKLNGVPVFIKGANYIPQHSFLPELQKKDYRKLLTQAYNANINMLRVWGGGTYADDEFYKDCDKAGILVWQDFAFACAMYPGDKNFTENVKEEVKEQVKKLRSHPCLALWCGNNEIDEGWHNWGWQKQYKYSKSDSLKIWNDYKKLFHEIIPAIVKQIDFKTPYWPSSPSIGWGHKESLQQGDSHYWGVWWGNEPFEMYEKKVGRFMSEYGFQGMPALETFKTFCDSTDLNLNSAAVKNHQKHPTGYETILKYMERDYFVPKDFEKFIYVSQLLQAQGMKTAIESHRRAKPYCMGTLFWQLNDCWPVTSWSAIDINSTPKAFFHELKDLYADILISVKKEKTDYKVFIVNDKLQVLEGQLTLALKDFNGKILFSKTTTVKIPANSSAIYYTLTEKNLLSSDKEKIYLSCELKGAEINSSIKKLYFFGSPKNLKLNEPKLNLVIEPGGTTIKLNSGTLIKNLYSSNIMGQNYFDLEPGVEYWIKLKQPVKSAEEFRFLSINGINH